MEDGVVLTASHWIFLLVILTIIAFMIFRRDVVMPSIVGTFLIGLVYSGGDGFTNTIIGGAQVVFRAFLNAGTELLDIMLVIALMVAMLKSLQSQGADVLMIQPMKKLMKTPSTAFFVIGLTMYVAATFFWPTPAVALVGTVLIPIAMQVGLPAMGAAVSVNLMGHGMALSGDVVIQGATQLTSSASGVSTVQLLPFTALFSVTVGFVAITIAFIMIKRDMKKGKLTVDTSNQPVQDADAQQQNQSSPEEEIAATVESRPTARAKFLAFLVPATLFTIVLTMIYRAIFAPDSSIEGGDATALLGGSAVALLIIATVLDKGSKSIEAIAGHIREGFFFAIKIFAPIIPIAAFFFMGDPEQAQTVLGEGAPGFLFDLGNAAAPYFDGNKITLTFGMLVISLLAGMDGSGFSGLPLVGSLSAALGGGAGLDVAVLASLGQVATIFAGGGTLAAWAFGVAADAGIAGVKPIDLVRRNFIPVMVGLFVAACIAITIM
ncbi:hypothetical protein SAMN05192534_10212 [Alteribacillus persepolensis]|uniref:Uncharacterized protein n=1 Tax=Alteribacillus persepolensis TaxID=568899 RepID=A0A1G8A406_9BACI|nr:hypothetical protein [Alteribacillus persepolensis]SDH15616.1 hypothetical protein SAMN05192534_10212 [Alteribacillus persepolensis]